jgi:hypothetical protein
MAFKLKNIHDVIGIDKELSEYGRPVFVKNLEGGVKAEANRDGTTFIDSKVKGSERKEAIVHENIHHEQMQQGRLNYDDNNVYWKESTRSPMKTFNREVMEEGAKTNAWEAEAYHESDKVKK